MSLSSHHVTSLDLSSGELRLIEVKGIGDASGTILLTPNERRVAEDRHDCYWLYVVTNCNAEAKLQDPIKDSTLFLGHDAFFLENGNYQASDTSPCESGDALPLRCESSQRFQPKHLASGGEGTRMPPGDRAGIT
jgi:hypothetical protein